MNYHEWQSRNNSNEIAVSKQAIEVEKESLQHARKPENPSLGINETLQGKVLKSTGELHDMKEVKFRYILEPEATNNLVLKSVTAIEMDYNCLNHPNASMSPEIKKPYPQSYCPAMSMSSKTLKTDHKRPRKILSPIMIPPEYKRRELKKDYSNSVRSSILYSSSMSSLISSCMITESPSSVATTEGDSNSPLESSIGAIEPNQPFKKSHHYKCSSTTLPFIYPVGGFYGYDQIEDCTSLNLICPNGPVQIVSIDNSSNPIRKKKLKKKTIYKNDSTILQDSDAHSLAHFSRVSSYDSTVDEHIPDQVSPSQNSKTTDPLEEISSKVMNSSEIRTPSRSDNEYFTRKKSKSMDTKNTIDFGDTEGNVISTDESFLAYNWKLWNAPSFTPETEYYESRPRYRRRTTTSISEKSSAIDSRNSSSSLIELIRRASNLVSQIDRERLSHSCPEANHKQTKLSIPNTNDDSIREDQSRLTDRNNPPFRNNLRGNNSPNGSDDLIIDMKLNNYPDPQEKKRCGPRQPNFIVLFVVFSLIILSIVIPLYYCNFQG